jgi:hypothetical protein
VHLRQGSIAAAVVGVLSLGAFFAVAPEPGDPVRPAPRGFGGSPPISDHMPGRPLAELPYIGAHALTDSLVAVQRYAAMDALSDHRPLTDRP